MQRTFTAGARITELGESSVGRFEVRAFGQRKRLVWSGGACGLASGGSVLAWGDFALVQERARTLLFDARRDGALSLARRIFG